MQQIFLQQSSKWPLNRNSLAFRSREIPSSNAPQASLTEAGTSLFWGPQQQLPLIDTLKSFYLGVGVPESLQADCSYA